MFGVRSAKCGIPLLPTDFRFPRQKGKTERHGGAFKKQLRTARSRVTPVDDEELEAPGAWCVSARNRYSNCRGFSPVQRVLGITPGLPGSITCDDPIDLAYLLSTPTDDFRRASELRAAGLRAFHERLVDQVAERPPRQAKDPITSINGGDLVFVWRQPTVGNGFWTSPGVVLLPTAGGEWVNMRGSVWNVAMEQIRHATDEEHISTELVNRYVGSMKEDIEKRRSDRKFVDVVQEGAPRFPEEADKDKP